MTDRHRSINPRHHSGWDAHAEFKEAAAHARKALAYACSDLPERQPTVGKHAARNHGHLRQVYQEALTSNPRFADTLAWILWHRVRDFDRLALLTEPGKCHHEAVQRHAPCPGSAAVCGTPDLTQVLRVMIGLADQACLGGTTAEQWLERMDEVMHNPQAAIKYADHALDLPAPLLALLPTKAQVQHLP